MIEYQMTGYLKGCFVNKTASGRVMNFFVKSDGYVDGNDKYVDYEYAFETWHGSLIDKLLEIPRDSLVTVHFSITPKKVPLEGGRRGNYNQLKASKVTNWNAVKKEDKSQSDENYVQIEMVEISKQ